MISGGRSGSDDHQEHTYTHGDRDLRPLGGLYTQNSPAFHRGVPDDCSHCLKANDHDAGVMCEVRNSNLLAPNNFAHKAGDGMATRKRRETDVHPSLQANVGTTQATYLEVEVAPKLIGGIGERNFGKRWQPGNRVYDSDGVAATLTAQPCGRVAGYNAMYSVDVMVKEATKKGYAIAREREDSVNLAMPNSKTRRGRVGVAMANTLDTSCNQGIFVRISEKLEVYAVWYPKKECYIAIRKLTPKECFRLQGWTDDYFERAQLLCSDSQLYKQAGNGVTVSVIGAMAAMMSAG